MFHLDPEDVAAFDATFPPKAPAVLTPLDALDGVPPAVLVALRAHGISALEQVVRFSVAEVSRWDGVGASGAEELRRALQERAHRWGVPLRDG